MDVKLFRLAKIFKKGTPLHNTPQILLLQILVTANLIGTGWIVWQLKNFF